MNSEAANRSPARASRARKVGRKRQPPAGAEARRRAAMADARGGGAYGPTEADSEEKTASSILTP